MPRLTHIEHEFIDNIPRQLEDGVLYISMPFTTAMHSCCCGCGNPVVTPFSSTDWKMTFDGETISLHPSIGNWSFPCKSHYWIQGSKIHWAEKWSEDQINAVRVREQLEKDRYFATNRGNSHGEPSEQSTLPLQETSKTSLWEKLKQWFR